MNTHENLRRDARRRFNRQRKREDNSLPMVWIVVVITSYFLIRALYGYLTHH